MPDMRYHHYKEISELSDETAIRVSSQIHRRVLEGKVLYEKQYTTDDWGGTIDVIRRRAERESQLLEQIETSGLFRGRLGVVRVANCDPHQATIATYEIKGQPLKSWLHESAESRRSLLPWYLAGRWLRAFQMLPVSEAALGQLSEKDPPGLVEYCDVRLCSLRQLNYPWPDAATHRRLLRTLEILTSQQEAWAEQRVWVHADYAPGNLIWGDGVLTPIDFATARSGGPLDDATYLIHRLEMQRVYRPWMRLPEAAIRKAVLRGLGRPGAEASATYQALMIRHLICRLHTYVFRPPSRLRQALHDRWVRYAIRRRLLSAVSKVPDHSAVR